MPFDPPPLQPSPAERWHMEEMERLRILHWEQEQAEKKRWWESLTPDQRAAIEREREREKVEAAERAKQARREEEERAAVHQAAIEAHEAAHGGSQYLDEHEQRLNGSLAAVPAPDNSISLPGILIVLMFFALIPGLLFNGAFQSASGGILFAELLTVVGWGVWVLRRRERATLRTKLAHQREQVARWRGCGNADCEECYPDRHFRQRWQDARSALGRSNGCATPACPACYS